jgi:hypothetical protein
MSDYSPGVLTCDGRIHSLCGYRSVFAPSRHCAEATQTGCEDRGRRTRRVVSVAGRPARAAQDRKELGSATVLHSGSGLSWTTYWRSRQRTAIRVAQRLGAHATVVTLMADSGMST